MKLMGVIILAVVISVQAEGYYYDTPYNYDYKSLYENRHKSPYNYYNYYPQNARILQYDNENYGNGKYRFAYKQTDGQEREEQGQIVNEGQPNEHLAVMGSYTWMDPNGVPYKVKYTADENGYQPEIEQGPGGGVPPAVVASLLG